MHKSVCVYISVCWGWGGVEAGLLLAVLFHSSLFPAFLTSLVIIVSTRMFAGSLESIQGMLLRKKIKSGIYLQQRYGKQD